MTTQNLLADIVAKLDQGDAKDGKFPDGKGEYWALCPFHADRHSGSFSVSERGFCCHACGKKGGLVALAEHFGIEVEHTESPKLPPRPATLENYANVKGLPVDFLQSLGLRTIHIGGEPVVKMPYYGEDGTEAGVRFRVALAGDNKFKWRSGTKPMLYGLARLDRAAGYVILCEGESDAQTFWYHNVSALGVPGANNWRAEWAKLVEGLTVYVWREPDAGGETFVNDIGKALPDCRIITPPAGRKDISDCQLAGDDVRALVTQLKATARPWRELEAERNNETARAAYETAYALLHKSDLLAEALSTCRARGLVGEDRNAKLLNLSLVSRLQAKPVSLAVKGPSSGGKSYLVETVLKLFPAAAYYVASSLSDKLLARDDAPLKHRMLVLQEASGMSENVSYLLRVLLSEGCIVHKTLVETRDGWKPQEFRREGPTGLIVTTTWASLHPENETRLFSLTVRDDPTQTAGILQSLADRANGRLPEEPDYTQWHALHTWLELAGCRDVTIPFAHDLATLADTRAVRLRRDFGALLNLVCAHAILHQCTRERDQYGRIVATLADYAAVYDLLEEVVGDAIQATVAKTTRETVNTVARLIEDAKREGKPTEVSKAQLSTALGLDKSAAGRRATRAIHDGYLINLESKEKQPARYALGDAMPADKSVLPHPDVLRGLGGGGRGSLPSCTSAQVHITTPGAAVTAGTSGNGQNGHSEGENGAFAGLEAWQMAFLEEANA
jgi:hypothetical protein